MQTLESVYKKFNSNIASHPNLLNRMATVAFHRKDHNRFKLNETVVRDAMTMMMI